MPAGNQSHHPELGLVCRWHTRLARLASLAPLSWTPCKSQQLPSPYSLPLSTQCKVHRKTSNLSHSSVIACPRICVLLPTVGRPGLQTNQIREQGFHPSGCWSKGLHTKAAQCTAPAPLISRRTSRGFQDHSIEGKLFETLHNPGLTERYEAAKF